MGATLADMTSLEELLNKMMRQKMIPQAVIDALWDIFGRCGHIMSHAIPTLVFMSCFIIWIPCHDTCFTHAG